MEGSRATKEEEDKEGKIGFRSMNEFERGKVDMEKGFGLEESGFWFEVSGGERVGDNRERFRGGLRVDFGVTKGLEEEVRGAIGKSLG